MNRLDQQNPSLGPTNLPCLSLAGLGMMAVLCTSAPASALQVAVVSSEDSPTPGDVTHFRVWVANDSATTVQDVTATALVPPDTSMAFTTNLLTGRLATAPRWSCPDGFTACIADNTISVPLGELFPGQSRLIDVPLVVATSAAGGSAITLDVSVSGIGQTTVNASAQTIVATAPAAAVDITAEEHLVVSGSTVRFEVTFAAISTLAVPELVVTLPTGATLVPGHGGTVTGSEISWTPAALSAGMSDRRTFEVNLPAGALHRFDAVLRNRGSAVAAAGDVVSVGSSAGLVLDVQETVMNPNPGETPLYRVVVSNEGVNPLLDVQLDVIPAQESDFRATQMHAPIPSAVYRACPWIQGSSGDCTTNEMFTWELGTIPAGSQRILELPLRIRGDAINGAIVASQFVAHSAQSDGPLLARRGAVIRTAPGLRVATAVDHQTTNQGATLTFEYTAGNADSTTASSVELVATIPEGATVLSPTVPAGSESVTWNLGNLPSQTIERRQMTVSLPASADIGSLASSIATLFSDGVLQARSGDTAVVRPADDLVLHVGVDADRVQNANLINHRIVVSNHGADDVNGIEVWMATSDRTAMPFLGGSLPATQCDWILGTSGNCTVTEWMQWPIGTLGPGESTVVHVPVQAATPLVGEPLTAQVEVRVADELRGGTRRVAMSQASLEANLGLSLSRAAAVAGAPVELEVVAGNNGSTSLPDTQVTVDVPAGLTFVSAESGGTFDAATRQLSWPAAALGADESERFRAVVQIDAASTSSGDILGVVARMVVDEEIAYRVSESISVAGTPTLDVRVARVRDSLAPNDGVDMVVTIANLDPNEAARDVVLQMLPGTNGLLPSTGLCEPSAGDTTLPVARRHCAAVFRD